MSVDSTGLGEIHGILASAAARPIRESAKVRILDDLSGKVALVHDEALDARLPVRVAIVEIDLNDGTRLTERVEAVRGTPRNPMSRDEVIDKARDLMAPVLGDDTSERLIETVYDIERVSDVRGLRSLLQRSE